MRTVFALAATFVAAGCGGARGTRPITAGEERALHCDVPNVPADDQFHAATRLAHAGDPQAIPAYVRACDAGHPCSCTEAGEAFVDGTLVEVDLARGFALLDRGCEGGDTWGCWAEAWAIWRHAPDRVEHAAELMENACEDGNARACGELGRFRISGVAGGAAASDAVPLYDRACQGGESYFCYLQGEAFVSGIGAGRDEERATELLTWSCETAGVAQACTARAHMLPGGDSARAELLRRACDGGDVFACDELDPSAASRTGTADQALTFDAAAAQPVAASAPTTIEAPLAGAVDLSTLGLRPACVGFVGAAADAVIEVPAGLPSITIRAHADADTVLAVRDPGGRWTCADDPPAGIYQARITIATPAAGQYAIWGGQMLPAEVPGSIEVSTP